MKRTRRRHTPGRNEISRRIDAYVKALLPWQREIVVALREVVHKADPEIVEDWKWDKPAFSHDGLVCWICPFKKWVSFTLFQGSLVPDTHRLYNHGTFMDRNRTIAFASRAEIREKPLIGYIRKAVANNVAGRKVKVARKRRQMPSLPEFVRRTLRGDLRAAFDARPPYQRRDYVAWIAGAKQAGTREKRLSQMLDELRAGDLYMGMRWAGGKRS